MLYTNPYEECAIIGIPAWCLVCLLCLISDISQYRSAPWGILKGELDAKVTYVLKERRNIFY